MTDMIKTASTALRAILAGGSMFVLGTVISQPFTVADRVDATQTLWQALTVMGDEVEGFESLQSMAAASDCILRAHIAGFGISRQFQGDAEEDVVTYVRAELDVSDVIRGENCRDVDSVEFLLPAPPERAQETVKTQSQQLPQEELIWVLRRKRGDDESGLYRLVNSRGLWAQSGQGVYTPLTGPDHTLGGTGVEEHAHEYGHDSGSIKFANELSWVGSLDDLADLLKG